MRPGVFTHCYFNITTLSQKVNTPHFLVVWKYCAFTGISFGKFFVRICLAPDGYLLTILVFPSVGHQFTVNFCFTFVQSLLYNHYFCIIKHHKITSQLIPDTNIQTLSEFNSIKASQHQTLLLHETKIKLFSALQTKDTLCWFVVKHIRHLLGTKTIT